MTRNRIIILAILDADEGSGVIPPQGREKGREKERKFEQEASRSARISRVADSSDDHERISRSLVR